MKYSNNLKIMVSCLIIMSSIIITGCSREHISYISVDKEVYLQHDNGKIIFTVENPDIKLLEISSYIIPLKCGDTQFDFALGSLSGRKESSYYLNFTTSEVNSCGDEKVYGCVALLRKGEISTDNVKCARIMIAKNLDEVMPNSSQD